MHNGHGTNARSATIQPGEEPLQHPQARALILFSLVLLAVAVAPTALGEALSMLGMDPRVARMAGSRLAVMSAMSGAGMLLVGITLWARADRLLRISQGHARMLEHLAPQTVTIIDGPSALAMGEFDGLRADVVVPPQVGGVAIIHARCHPAADVLSYEQQMEKLTGAGYALWDVIKMAEVKNSDDGSINLKNSVANVNLLPSSLGANKNFTNLSTASPINFVI